jgi:Concanavalin A-like lectin/glucanases superfamily
MDHAVASAGTIARRLFFLLLVLLIAVPGYAAVSSDGTSTQHLGGVGGRLPTVNAQALMGWFYLESDINRAAVLILYTTNDANGDAMGFQLNADGTTLEAIIVDAGAISDIASIQALTVGKWYHLAIVRVDASTFRFYVGDESTASTLRATLTRTIENQTAGWGLGLLGAGVPNASPHARIERWKHYTDALSVTRIEEERASLTPFSTTDLFSYNPLTTSGSYAGTAGSAPYTFTEQGDSKFSTAAGPTVSSGGRRSAK